MQQQSVGAADQGKLDQVMQQVAEHKGCGTSGGSGKASCGSGAGQNDLAPEIWEKVKNHPYSERHIITTRMT
jgi:nitrogen fixation protein NifB